MVEKAFLHIKKFFKIIFISIITIFLFIILLEAFIKIEQLNSRSSSLVYANDMVKSNTLIGMSYSDCCNYLEDVKKEYGYFDFVDEYVIRNEENGIINYFKCRSYHVGYALNDAIENRAFYLKVIFNKGTVVAALIEEAKG